jgi:hypothetical protein
MKNLFIFFAVCISYLSYSQQYLHQVLVLNEGYFDFSLNQTVVPPTIGSYDPISEVYTTLDTLTNSRFASDMIIEGDFVYVAADNILYKYDINTMNIVTTQNISGIRNLAVWNDKIAVSRGDYDNTTFAPILFNSYLQFYNTSDLSFYSELDTITGPKWSTQNMIVENDNLYITINNAFEFGNEKGIVGVVDMTSMSYINEIDLGPDGKNPDNLLIRGNKLYTVNNKDWSGASISEIDLTSSNSTTTNISLVSTGCGTSCLKDDKIIYQISQDTELYEWDLLTAPNAGSPLGFSQNFYELAVNNLDGYIYASSTDFFSYGTINIYDQNNNFVKSFNTSITPGKIIFDTRNTSVSINEINPLIGKENIIYDLNGKQINSIKNTTNGVYILNGKKVFIKR